MSSETKVGEGIKARKIGEAEKRFLEALDSAVKVVNSSNNIKPLTGMTEDYSGLKGIEKLGSQIKYSKNLVRLSQAGPTDFDSIFSGQ